MKRKLSKAASACVAREARKHFRPGKPRGQHVAIAYSICRRRGFRSIAPRPLGGLGAADRKQLVLYGVAGIVGLGAFLFATGAFAAEPAVSPMPLPMEDPCGAEALQRVLANGAAGAGAGVAAGGAGAAVGAGAGIALSPQVLQCGLPAINKAKAALCKKADQVVKQLRAKGGAVPKEYDRWSCDQKIAFVAALGPEGVAMVLAGALAGKWATATANEIKKLTGDAANAFTSNTKGATNAVKSVGKKIGLGAIRYGFAGRACQEID
jgi:hypothetical protein